MLFGKKKRMIDVRELQRRGVVRLPKNEDVVPTNSDGFVDMRSNTISPKKTNSDLFYGNKQLKEKATTFSTETEGYSKREVDAKMVELDNKIYKLEQRLEVLERRIGVNQPTYSGSSPLANW